MADTSLRTAPKRVVAIDIGGTKIASALATVPAGLPAGASDFPAETAAIPSLSEIFEIATPAQDGATAVVDAVFQAVRGALTHAPEGADAIGIASAGVVDPETGNIISATDLIKGWAGTALGTLVEEEFGLPTSVLNDVHAHALGESTYGAAQNLSSVLSVAVGTGIGGALVLNGEIHFGAHFAAGHVGHVPHPLAMGLPCSCGAYGHIESVASGTGQVTLYNKRHAATREISSGRELTELANAGDEMALCALIDSGAALGDTLAGIANCYNPEAIVLSGSVTRSGEKWWDALETSFRAGILPALKDTKILLGTLGGSAPLLGATVFAMNSAHNKTTGESND
ncbi:MAG: ROK family protein [Actinomycetaceae bacterium]|nr:ROK family protein [Actinomycetaceae bacterium]